MRSRLVAQQFNWAKREDVTQNTPPLVAVRLLVSKAVNFWTQGLSRGAVSGSVGLQCRFSCHAPLVEDIVEACLAFGTEELVATPAALFAEVVVALRRRTRADSASV